MPILCHHMAGVRASEGADESGIKQVLESARLPNIYIKVSGFYYGSKVRWEYPYSDVMWAVRTLYEHFGPQRMCWGSDYPVSSQSTTYRQCVEVLRTHCTFMSEHDREQILGETLDALLTRSKTT